MTDASSCHTIAIAQVLQTIQGAWRLGLDVSSATLLRAGSAPALLDSPLSRVTQAQYAALRRVCRDELRGLCSHPVKVGSFAQVCQALVHCRTLGEAVRTAFGFLPPGAARLRAAPACQRLCRACGHGDVARV
jgi:hypothetical protein